MTLYDKKIKAKCICENCEPTAQYTKKEWTQFNHVCPECNKSLDIAFDESGETYSIEEVHASDLRVGDYIFCSMRYCQIVSIKDDIYKKNKLFISVLNYGSISYGKDEQVCRLSL